MLLAHAQNYAFCVSVQIGNGWAVNQAVHPFRCLCTFSD